MGRRRSPRRGRGSSGAGSSPPVAQATFAFNVTSLAIEAVAGQAAFVPESDQGDAVAFVITNSGSGQFSAPSFSDNAAWLTLAVTTGSDGSITLAPTIDPSALGAGSYTGTITCTDANASNSGATVTVALTVAAAVPTIAVAPFTLPISLPDETAGTVQSVTISNAGFSTLATPTVGTITYSGAFTNWVSATNVVDNGDGTFTLEITPTAVGGTVGGPYTATVPIVSTGASNTPFDYTATLTVTTGAAAVLALDRSLDDSAGDIGGADAPAQSVGVRSANSTPLAGPVVGTITYSGTHNNWCTAAIGGVSGTTLTATLDTNSLVGEGTSFANIPVTDPNAATGVTYQVYLRMGAAASGAALIVAPTAISRNANLGEAISDSTLAITNGGSGGSPALGTVTATFTPSVTWAAATIASGTVTITFSSAVLNAATYTGTLRIAASGATNSPIDVPVQLVVSSPSGSYVSPVYTLPSFITHDTNDDSLDGTPYAKPALGSFA